MNPIVYLDRASGRQKVEKVYGGAALKLLYGSDLVSRILGPAFIQLLSKIPFMSALYGYWQTLPFTKGKIIPFIRDFDVDPSEFLEPVSSFCSFNDFFIRKLKPEARPLAPGADTAVIPADGRYLFYPNIAKCDGFVVKGEKFDLAALLDDSELAAEYEEGSMVIARLCPSDYHRYHFPCSGVPKKARLINGWLYSVNPAAIKRDIHIFTKNKRSLCEIESDHFGKVLFIAIGATFVGSIHQTYEPGKHYKKGDEKGYFSFGASSLILLFKSGQIVFDKDLVAATERNMEIKCLVGESLGTRTFFETAILCSNSR